MMYIIIILQESFNITPSIYVQCSIGLHIVTGYIPKLYQESLEKKSWNILQIIKINTHNEPTFGRFHNLFQG